MSTNLPELSVVIASISGWEPLAECLTALARQQGAVHAEVIVVEAKGSTVSSFVRRDHPQVRLLPLEHNPTIPRLRAAGIHAARGGIIAITEDHCIPRQDWYESIRRAHGQREAAAIGGAVDNAATGRLVDWAVYFCEYGRYSSPLRDGTTDDLPGPNVSYKRSALLGVPPLVADEYWETFVHDDLRRLGHLLWSDPAIRVDHRMHFRFWSFMVERYHYGRAYAARRNPILGSPGRLRHGALSPLLIPFFVLRISRHTLLRRRHWFRFACSLPMLCCFAAAAAAGEGVGYMFGGGDSALRVR